MAFLDLYRRVDIRLPAAFLLVGLKSSFAGRSSPEVRARLFLTGLLKLLDRSLDPPEDELLDRSLDPPEDELLDRLLFLFTPLACELSDRLSAVNGSSRSGFEVIRSTKFFTLGKLLTLSTRSFGPMLFLPARFGPRTA